MQVVTTFSNKINTFHHIALIFAMPKPGTFCAQLHCMNRILV